jgi:hypothetical protein
MNKQHNSKPAHPVQPLRRNNFHRRSVRPITAAEPHAFQLLSLLRQAQRESCGRRAICISQLLKAQGSIYRALGLLRSSEAGIEIELYGDERQYVGVSR